MRKLIFLLCLIPAFCFGLSSIVTQVVQKWTAYYDIPRNLVWAIMIEESRGRIYATSDDYKVQSRLAWCREVIRRNGLSTNDRAIYSSIGLMQISFLVAKDLGFRGGVDQLYQIDNNIRYGCFRLWQIRKDHLLRGEGMLLMHWLYHYNQDSDYCKRVMKIYHDLEAKKWD